MVEIGLLFNGFVSKSIAALLEGMLYGGRFKDLLGGLLSITLGQESKSFGKKLKPKYYQHK